MRGSAVLAAILVVLSGCAERQPGAQPDPLQGAWRVAGMDVITADRDTVTVPTHESLVIFDGVHYSIGYAFGAQRTPPYAERWQPTEEEKAARFGSLIMSSGTYRTNGDRIDARPLLALAPEFVGGEAVFFFEFAADTLLLRWDKSVAFDGLEYPSGGSVVLLRLVRASE